jgi:hypothetical protein
MIESAKATGGGGGHEQVISSGYAILISGSLLFSNLSFLIAVLKASDKLGSQHI